MPSILLLEDDADIRAGMDQHLKREGFTVAAYGEGKDALKALQASGAKFDVALLDLTLPDMDGLDVLRAIRGGPLRSLPVVLVTARNEEIDRVLGLELGADDYISKPFSVRELVARVRAILRRAAFIEDTAHGQVLTFGALSVDLDMHIARVEGEPIELTRREFELLAYFLKNPRRVLGRERILQQVWGLEYLGESRTIDAHVRRVRSKLGPAADLIETVVGVGYRLGSVEK
jgi:DNA-binding response OmpR family regulator